MEVIFLVLPLALLLGGAFLWACVRAIRSGQFDDLETPALRILFDDDAEPASRPRDAVPPG